MPRRCCILFFTAYWLAPALASICDFGTLAPPYYVTYKAEGGTIKVDGDLSEPAWQEVAWTTPNMDICGPNNCSRGAPRFSTRQKVRWDDKFLYIAAELEEPQVWANNTQHDSVIFADNDYEVFISPDGTSHYYKEYEMNARNANWDLCLNKAYRDGGSENSSRVFPGSGFDELGAGLHSATQVVGCQLNKPGPCRQWTAEVAMPLSAIVYNTTAQAPPTAGEYWRINFSRVEWKVKAVGDGYTLDGSCKWPCPGGSDDNPGDNWVWAPTGAINVHMPEYWGYLQFAEGPVNATEVHKDPDYTVRSVAMQIYYAQHEYTKNHANYTNDLAILSHFAPLGGHMFDGTCTAKPSIRLLEGTKRYVASVAAKDGARVAYIRDDGYIYVRSGTALA